MTLYLISKSKDASLYSDEGVIRAADVTTAATCADMVARLDADEELRRAALAEAVRAATRDAEDKAEREMKARYAEQFARMEARAADLGREARQQAEALAVAIVRQIAPGLAEDRLVAALARRAVASLDTDRPLEVHVHPDAAQAVQQRLAERAGRLTIVADETLAPRDCLVIGPHGSVDAGLDAQLSALETAFAERAEEDGLGRHHAA